MERERARNDRSEDLLRNQHRRSRMAAVMAASGSRSTTTAMMTTMMMMFWHHSRRCCCDNGFSTIPALFRRDFQFSKRSRRSYSHSYSSVSATDQNELLARMDNRDGSVVTNNDVLDQHNTDWKVRIPNQCGGGGSDTLRLTTRAMVLEFCWVVVLLLCCHFVSDKAHGCKRSHCLDQTQPYAHARKHKNKIYLHR